jgi:hypothetical protein
MGSTPLELADAIYRILPLTGQDSEEERMFDWFHWFDRFTAKPEAASAVKKAVFSQ